MSRLLDPLLNLHGLVVYLLVAAVVFTEDALFVGFVVPGETAAVLGGVAASRGHVSLAIIIAVVVAAAIIGDSAGYQLGAHYAPRLLSTRLVGRHQRHIDAAGDLLARRGGPAVFLGRFVAYLRAVMPFLAGAARVPYRRFWPTTPPVAWSGGLGRSCWATWLVTPTPRSRRRSAVSWRWLPPPWSSSACSSGGCGVTSMRTGPANADQPAAQPDTTSPRQPPALPMWSWGELQPRPRVACPSAPVTEGLLHRRRPCPSSDVGDLTAGCRFGSGQGHPAPWLPSVHARMRRRVRPVAPDRTALASGVSGLALTAISALVRAVAAGGPAGGATRPALAAAVFALVSLASLGLGVLAVWSAVKAWLRDDALSVPARWGAGLGLVAVVLVAATGSCGPHNCPG